MTPPGQCMDCGEACGMFMRCAACSRAWVEAIRKWRADGSPGKPRAADPEQPALELE